MTVDIQKFMKNNSRQVSTTTNATVRHDVRPMTIFLNWLQQFEDKADFDRSKSEDPFIERSSSHGNEWSWMRTSPISQCLQLSTAEKGTKNWPIFYCPGKNVCADTCCQCCCALDCHLLWKDSCVINKNVITDINLLLFLLFWWSTICMLAYTHITA